MTQTSPGPQRFDGKVALITGGGAGIGAACSERLGAEGATVVVLDRDIAAAERTAAAIRDAGGAASSAAADVSNWEEIDNAVDRVVKDHGALHVAVNNAGISGPQAPLPEYPIDGWRTVVSVNLDGVFYCLRAELRQMLTAASGAIVNVGSMFSVTARTGVPAYVATKHAVLGLTRAAALECAATGVRVNAVGPGRTATPMMAASQDAETVTRLVAEVPTRRLGTPEEIAAVVAFLCSDDASYVTGAFYSADGGFTAQ
jgi:NAD(P)-dependent dehydrogenase (short-subunit alcohol dehydrogenase family)